MKNNRIISLPVLILLLLPVFACKKTTSVNDSPVFKAEIKQLMSCAKYYACVITDGDINPELVDNSWKQGDSFYQKAFVVKNSCHFPMSLKEGDSFYFQIEKNPMPNTCAICEIAIVNAPKKNLDIRVVELD